VDTGSVVTTMALWYYEDHYTHIPLQDVNKIYKDFTLRGASGRALDVKGYIEVEVLFPGLQSPIMALMLVTNSTDYSMDTPIIVGTNLIDLGKKEVQRRGVDASTQPDGWGVAYVDRVLESDNVGLVRNGASSQFIPGGTEQNIYATARVKPSIHDRHVILTPVTQIHTKTTLEFVPVLHIIPAYKRTVSLPVRVRNSEDVTQVIAPSAPLYNMDRIEWTEDINLDETNFTETENEFLNQFEWDNMEITEQQKNLLKQLLLAYQDIFAKDDADLGECDIEEHHIKLDDETPFRERYRRIPPQWYEEVKQHLDNMIKAGVIRESYSPWMSTITIAMKKGGKIRLCVDYRKLNLRTKKDAKTIPRIDETMDTLAGATIFSCIDMMSGYWQSKMHPDSVEYTAFTAGSLGFYEFLRLPFGLCNSGATFQRMMEKVLKQLLHKECLVYIDDVIIFSPDFKTHLERLARVLERFREHNLKLKAKKCTFAQSKITYLGHQVSADGISKDPEKIKALDNFTTPRDVKELRRFLGFTGYFRRFIPGYSIIAKPLTDLLRGYSNKKGKRRYNKKLEEELWKWGPEQEESFETMKSELRNDQILAYADFTLPFVLEVDASRDGLGAMLYQVQKGKKRPIAFGSRRTSAAEQNYPTHKLEFLALKWAVTEKFKDYLHCKEFTAYTDNNPMTYVLKSAKLDATSQRWCAELANYNFSLKYKTGITNKAADALSRQYDPDQEAEEEHVKWAKQFNVTVEQPVVAEVMMSVTKPDECVINHLVMQSATETDMEETHCPHILGSHVINMIAPEEESLDNTRMIFINKEEEVRPMTLAMWRKVQQSDPDIGKVLHLIETRKFLDMQELKQSSQVVKQLLRDRKRFVIREGALHRKRQWNSNTQFQLVVPASHRELIIYMMHEKSGHLGEDRTLDNVQTRFYWPGIRQSVRARVSTCERCVKRKRLPANNKVKLAKLGDTSRPFQRVSIDFLTVDFRKNSKHKILTVVDEFTRYGFALDVTSEQASNTARTLFNQVFSRFGFPEQLHSDQGKTFVSKVMKELCDLAKVHQTTTVAYNPTGNSKCERLNQTILNLLGTLSPAQKRNWKDFLPSIMFAYNTTTHESTDFSPFYLMFGRNPRLPVDEILGLKHEEEIVGSVAGYAKNLRTNLKEAYRKCVDRMKAQQKRHKLNYDNKLRRAVEQLQPGDIVLAQKVKKTSKIDDRWEDSPFQVISHPNEDIPVYIVKNMTDGRTRTLHRNFLQPFFITDHETQEENKLRIRRQQYQCGKNYVELKSIDTWQQYVEKFELPDLDIEVKEEVVYDTAINGQVSLWKGDITHLEVDVIVNAAKESLQGGTGVDGAIHTAAGPELLEECLTLDGCKVGQAKITKGYNLPAKHVIHTVGPVNDDHSKLKSAYKNSLKLADQSNVKSMAFPCIATGVYKFPREQAAHIALSTVRQYLSKPHKVKHIVLCVNNARDERLYQKIMQVYFPVKTVTEEEQSTESEEDEDELELEPASVIEGSEEESEEEHIRTHTGRGDVRQGEEEESVTEEDGDDTEEDEHNTEEESVIEESEESLAEEEVDELQRPSRQRKPPDRFGEWVYHQRAVIKESGDLEGTEIFI
jgi:O-acetyl-ADP-ribose deacetylase (regulator of RNase III)